MARRWFSARNNNLLAGLMGLGEGMVLRLGRRGTPPDPDRSKQPAVSRKKSTITHSINGGNMKKILKQLLVCMLLITLILPLLPVSTASSPLTQNEMRLITGGRAADCPGFATSIQVLCIMVGGGSTTCAIAYGIALVSCLVSSIL